MRRYSLRVATGATTPSVPKKASLHDVAQRALEDPTFFAALSRDPRRALANANWALDPRDMQKLRRSLSGSGRTVRVEVQPRRLFRVLNRLPASTLAELGGAWGLAWRESPPLARGRRGARKK